MDVKDFNIKVSGEGLPFIWGHGLMGSMVVEDATGWYKWDTLAEHIKLVRYDARGHGQSSVTDSPEDYHWKNLAGDMISIMDDLGIDQFVAGGQSMGCSTAIYTALAAPERVVGLVLMNPPTSWETREEQSSLYKKMALAAQLLGGGTLAKIMKKNPGRLLPEWLVEENREKVLAYADAVKLMSRKSLNNILKGAMISNLPKRDLLKVLNMPSFILAWTGDTTHPLETAQTLNGLLKKSELTITENAAGFFEWPEKIRDFLLSLET